MSKKFKYDLVNRLLPQITGQIIATDGNTGKEILRQDMNTLNLNFVKLLSYILDLDDRDSLTVTNNKTSNNQDNLNEIISSGLMDEPFNFYSNILIGKVSGSYNVFRFTPISSSLFNEITQSEIVFKKGQGDNPNHISFRRKFEVNNNNYTDPIIIDNIGISTAQGSGNYIL